MLSVYGLLLLLVVYIYDTTTCYRSDQGILIMCVNDCRPIYIAYIIYIMYTVMFINIWHYCSNSTLNFKDLSTIDLTTDLDDDDPTHALAGDRDSPCRISFH